ncbi:Regulatory protein GAL4 [Tolypocladium paradoxum]|uniref:Regulatory protein GAL4 n=1 Tax=Tolypocladium paradoxum TaxID=94208 RepID=A0A2S4L5Z3_9HYPO|nr:Regulatory protein GAL4 [Tolypocladium paradoxum]
MYACLSVSQCSRDRPGCTACVQNGRQCHYSGRVVRSPLTRAYLTSVEKRLHYLEKLVAERLPELSVDDELAAISSPRSSSTPGRAPEQHIAASTSSRGDQNAPRAEESISEAVPDAADGFDWQEEANELVDGMVALSIEPTGAGYLGSTAGVFFLRPLLSWIDGQRSHLEPRPSSAAASPQSPRPTPLFSAHIQRSLESGLVLNQLLQTFFSVYHSSYPFVHEATFMAQYHQLAPRPSNASWQALLHTILALGAWCLNSEDSELEDYIYHRAISFREDESLFESANLTLVQALVLLSNLSQKRNKPNTGGNLLGLATRMALSLGLHRELPAWNISLLQREMRRRVWWGLYMFDSGASTTFGRPILLPGGDAMDQLTPRTVDMPEESNQPTRYSGIKFQCDFHVHSNHISNRLLAPSGVSPDEAIRLNQSLETWSKTLPAYFHLGKDEAARDGWYLFTRAKLWWRLWNLQIILFRQIVLRRAMRRTQDSHSTATTDSDNKCRDLAVHAAQSTVVSIHDFLGQVAMTRLINWYATNFLFHAALLSALAILGDPESPELAAWQADVEMASYTFRNLLAENPLASRCADILSHVLPPQHGNASDLVSSVDFYGDEFDISSWPMDPADAFSSLGWSDFGQGIVLKIESFAAEFLRVYIDSGFKGWFVSTLLLAAWLGSLVNGPVADRFGRKGSMLAAVVIFVLGSALQAAACTTGVLFGGRAVAGFAVGMLTMIVPMYMSEVSTAGIRGTLVVLQQLSITLCILVSYWLEYGTQYIGGTRCAPDIPYTGGTESSREFDPIHDVGPNGCTGQREAAWRAPFALQIAPALVLGIGMPLFPESPRFFLMRKNGDRALESLAILRRIHPDSDALREECLSIKGEVLFDESVARDNYPGKSGFMGCNAMIYYAPTIFGQLGLSGSTTSLLATGVYGIVNTLSTLPAVFLIDKVGRRPLLMCGALGTFVSLVTVGAIVGAHGSDLTSHQSTAWTGIAFIHIYDVFFAAFCLIALGFTYFFVPETKGRSLKDMDVAFGDTAAREEKMRLFTIAATLGLTAPVPEEKIGADAEERK